ncbi:MAG: DPP IV N-terminal domain-containing protein [Anaerolineae bacterium]|nr:DPP IV N-terminal domain-containing protein [Anaerolineae bacterium]
MLTRLLRLTDKLIAALLRVVSWCFEQVARQLYLWRISIVGILALLTSIALYILRGGRALYAATAERSRAMMARRAEQIAAQGMDKRVLREDPLKMQNRALSLFTVVLLVALIGLIVWTTSGGSATRSVAGNFGGSLQLIPTQPTPTPVPPTPTPLPTFTPVPDPLRISGSLVYSARLNGRENLWALGIGQSQPIRLTNTPTDDRDPAWSPDGTRVAFASRRGGNWNLYLLEIATGAITQLTYTAGYVGAPSWSPDGQFIAYEAYEGGNLDIYVVASDGSSPPARLTYHPAPDFSPAWNPGGTPVPGRQIAYVSLRDGNPEIYVIDLDRPLEEEALRLTNTPELEEQYPTWNPQGTQIAYHARVNGIDLVLVRSLAQPSAEPLIIGRGRAPSWSPSGNILLFALESGANTTIVSSLVTGSGAAATAISVIGRMERMSWTAQPLPEALLLSGGAPEDERPLYVESVEGKRDSPPYYQVRALSGVSAATLAALSDRVDDSFIALREAVLRQSGVDFLGALQDALWTLDRLPEPGQPRQSWHYAGRAFSFDRNLVFNTPIPPIEVVREEVGANVMWRVYLRVAETAQNGQLGEPLKRLPWDFASRAIGDPQIFEQGGRPKPVVPSGYYIDLTRLAEDYGWQRVPAGRDWRSNFPSILYWQFERRDGLTWDEAMLELYTQAQIDAFLFGVRLQPTATPTATASQRRTPTPRPPDLGN